MTDQTKLPFHQFCCNNLAPQADESTGTRSDDQNQERQIQKTPLCDDGDTRGILFNFDRKWNPYNLIFVIRIIYLLDEKSEVATQQVPPKGSLYHELIKHQVRLLQLHQSSLVKSQPMKLVNFYYSNPNP